MSRVYFGKLLLRVEVFFCIPKRNADVNFEIHFLRLGLLGVQTIFETISCSMSELFIAKWRNLCQFHHVVSAVVVLATLSTFQFQILVHTSQMQSISRYDDFFSYFWPDDDK